MGCSNLFALIYCFYYVLLVAQQKCSTEKGQEKMVEGTKIKGEGKGEREREREGQGNII